MKHSDTSLTLALETQQDWETWLQKHQSEAKGVRLKLAKKATGLPSISYAEAVEGALCYEWIDGRAASHDRQYWRQRFTLRGPRSHRSQVNRDKVGILQAVGKMRAAGIRQVELAEE